MNITSHTFFTVSHTFFNLHLPDDVKKFGPLWVLSCYPFENFNGTLKNYVHGSNHPELQVCFLCLSEIRDRFLKRDSAVYYFCKENEKSGTHRRKIKEIAINTFIVGLPIKDRNLPSYILDILSDNLIEIEKSKYHTFNRLLHNNIYYENEFYARNKKTNSTCIKFM